MGFLSEYNAKLTSAETAVKCVKSGDWVEYTSNLGFPAACDLALSKRRDELKGVKIRGDLIFGPIQVIECDPEMEHFVYNTWHCSGYERKMCDKGRAFFEPMVFRNLAWYYKNFLTSDVCMVTVSGMDDDGYFYFGPSLGMSKCIADNSKIVIVEVNRNIPRIKGSEEARIHISEVNYIVETGEPPLFEMPNPAPTETDVKIANLLLPYIKDGACVQLGIGGMPSLSPTAISRILACTRSCARMGILPCSNPESSRMQRKRCIRARAYSALRSEATNLMSGSTIIRAMLAIPFRM